MLAELAELMVAHDRASEAQVLLRDALLAAAGVRCEAEPRGLTGRFVVAVAADGAPPFAFDESDEVIVRLKALLPFCAPMDPNGAMQLLEGLVKTSAALRGQDHPATLEVVREFALMGASAWVHVS